MWIELMIENHTQYRKYHPQLNEELLVGTTDRRNVNYVAVLHHKIHQESTISYSFFQQDKHLSTPIRLNADHESSFEELGKQVPQLRESLERCVKELLSQPLDNLQQCI